MKTLKTILLIIMSFFSVCACNNTSKDKLELNPDKIYFFYQTTCPHCHHAIEYINNKYPNLNMILLNIENTENYKLLVKCAQKFKLQNRIGTPLFCMGEHHLMGWSEQYEKQFDTYAKPFIK